MNTSSSTTAPSSLDGVTMHIRDQGNNATSKQVLAMIHGMVLVYYINWEYWTNSKPSINLLSNSYRFKISMDSLLGSCVSSWVIHR